MGNFFENLFQPDFKLLITILSLAALWLQYRRAKIEERNFRQQLISLMHHAEGVEESLSAISFDAANSKYSNLTDVAAALRAVQQNAKSLLLGLIETKVGGTSVKTELDKKYSERVDLELELKKLPARNFIDKTNAIHLKEMEDLNKTTTHPRDN